MSFVQTSTIYKIFSALFLIITSDGLLHASGGNFSLFGTNDDAKNFTTAIYLIYPIVMILLFVMALMNGNANVKKWRNLCCVTSLVFVILHVFIVGIGFWLLLIIMLFVGPIENASDFWMGWVAWVGIILNLIILIWSYRVRNADIKIE